MHKLMIKLFMAIIFAVLMSITIKTNKEVEGNKFVITSNEAMASSIPCYSMSKRNWNHAYVDCASCTRITGWRATGGAGSCSSGGGAGGGNGGPVLIEF